MERIFADKILAAEFYYQREAYLDVAKHVFDLSVMMEMLQIQRLLSDHNTFLQMLGYKRQEEKERIGSDLADKPFSDFQLFKTIGDNMTLQKQFDHMQDVYVFNEKRKRSYSGVVGQMNKLYAVLLRL